MSYSPANESAFNDSHLRSSKISPCSGMCSFCTADCTGTCEIGLAAVLGKAMVYPTNTGENQVASEKDNPLNYSIFNINGRVFGALGAPEDNEQATIFNVQLERTLGKHHPIRIQLPFMLPALIKLNWKDYFSAAALAGTICVVGESAVARDPHARYENGKVVQFDLLQEILDSFHRYDRGYGQIVVQCNTEDDMEGIPEFALAKGAKAIEFKFGQSAKGTQPALRQPSREAALAKKQAGWLVNPDPEDPEIIALAESGKAPAFWAFKRLPMWTEDYLLKRIAQLRELGMENVYFKMAGYDRQDLERVLRLASEAEVDMVTFDGNGGGSGYSPVKMMNEFGLPALCLESALLPICKQLEAEGKYIPFLTLTGGFSSEEQACKALAIGAPYIKAIGLCRSAMAAAMTGDKIGKFLEEGHLPKHLQKFGSTKDELFLELGELHRLYGDLADTIPLGAVGAYSYLKKMAFGLQHFAALNRKFDVQLINQEDVIPLTEDARKLLKGTWFDW